MATEKRTKTISIVVTDEIYQALEGLAAIENMTLSKFGFKTFENIVELKKAELRVIAEAFGFNLNNV